MKNAKALVGGLALAGALTVAAPAAQAAEAPSTPATATVQQVKPADKATPSKNSPEITALSRAVFLYLSSPYIHAYATNTEYPFNIHRTRYIDITAPNPHTTYKTLG